MAAFGAAQRATLRAALAATAGVALPCVTIDRVERPCPTHPFLGVRAAVSMASDARGAEALVCALTSDHVVDGIGGTTLTASLGAPAPELCTAEVVDVTPTCATAPVAPHKEPENTVMKVWRGCRRCGWVGVGRVVSWKRAQQMDLAAHQPSTHLFHSPANTTPVVLQPLPAKLQLDLPYASYRVVRADGSAPERSVKHPFCMSRVYYDATEKPEEVGLHGVRGLRAWREVFVKGG